MARTVLLVLMILTIHMCMMCNEPELVGISGYSKDSSDSLMVQRDPPGLTSLSHKSGVEPPVAPSSSQDTCLVLNPFTTPYSMSARFQKAVAGDVQLPADSIIVEARAPGNAFTNYFTWYTASGGFDDEGLRQLIQDTYVAQFVLLINRTDPVSEYYELYVGVNNPAVQANTTAFDRPGLYIQPYVNGQKAIDIGYVFDDYYVWPTVSMDILETQLAIEEFAHTYLNLQDTGLDPSEINTVVTWYQDNCITGDKVRLNGAVFDTAYVVPLFTDLGWNVTY